MDRKTELLHDLLERIEGCTRPDCLLCQETRKNVEELAALQGVNPDDIMPWWLPKPAPVIPVIYDPRGGQKGGQCG